MAQARLESKELKIAKELAIYLRNRENTANIHDCLRAVKQKFLEPPTGLFANFFGSSKKIDAEFTQLIDSKETPFNVAQLIVLLINKNDDFVIQVIAELQKKLSESAKQTSAKEIKQHLLEVFEAETMELQSNLDNLKLECQRVELETERKMKESERLNAELALTEQKLKTLEEATVQKQKSIDEMDKTKAQRERELRRHYPDVENLSESSIRFGNIAAANHELDKKELKHEKERIQIAAQAKNKVSSLKEKFTQFTDKEERATDKEQRANELKSLPQVSETTKSQVANLFRANVGQGTKSSASKNSKPAISGSTPTSNISTQLSVASKPVQKKRSSISENIAETISPSAIEKSSSSVNAKTSVAIRYGSIWEKLAQSNPEGANCLARHFNVEIPKPQ